MPTCPLAAFDGAGPGNVWCGQCLGRHRRPGTTGTLSRGPRWEGRRHRTVEANAFGMIGGPMCTMRG
jgi:hypothetical protein